MANVLDSLARDFIVDTGHLTLSVAGNLRVLFANPAGSGKVAYIQRIAGLSTSLAWAPMYVNPTAGLPAASMTPANVRVGGPASACTFQADTSATTALSGGSNTGLVIAAPANARFAVDLPAPFEVPPGVSLGINVPFTGSADVAFALYFFEE